jgi:hypothetical protein
MAALPGGGLRFGERVTGQIREVDPDGRLVAEPVATVAVSTKGQRGLLGLAVDAAGRTFAAWTRADRRLVVGQVAPRPERLVWLGPETTRLANGGHLVVTPDGDLVVGVGNLQARARVSDPHSPNGKLLRLEPDGSADQRPDVISSGWNNPFAFTITPSGALWVADNAGRGEAERLARGDVAGQPTSVTRLRGTIAPSGLAAIDDNHLVMCGYVSRRLDVYDVARAGRARRATPPLATDCTIGVIRLADSSLAYGNETSIRLVSPLEARVTRVTRAACKDAVRLGIYWGDASPVSCLRCCAGHRRHDDRDLDVEQRERNGGLAGVDRRQLRRPLRAEPSPAC